MVTKDYLRGVYKWVEAEYGNGKGTFWIESLNHRTTESLKTTKSLFGAFPMCLAAF